MSTNKQIDNKIEKKINVIKRRIVKENKLINSVTELFQAIQESGGTVNKNILDMSVRDFISQIAVPNNIHLIFRKENNE